MDDVKRYDCTNGGAQYCQGCYQMSETPLGDYVRADDYDALAASIPKWIRCEDALPNEGQCVNTSGYLFGDKTLGRWVEPSVFFEGEFHPCASSEDGEICADLDATMNTATHWMPLPGEPSD